MIRIEIDRLRTILLDPFFHKISDLDDFEELISVLNYVPENNWSLIVNNDGVRSQLINIGLSDYLQENLDRKSTCDASACAALDNLSPSVFISFLTCPMVKKMVAVGLVIGIAGLLSVAAIGVLGAFGLVAITPAASLIPALVMVGIGLLSLTPPAILCAQGSESIPRFGLNGYFFSTSASIARVDSSSESISLNGLNG